MSFSAAEGTAKSSRNLTSAPGGSSKAAILNSRCACFEEVVDGTPNFIREKIAAVELEWGHVLKPIA
jgi:hypothetical protein